MSISTTSNFELNIDGVIRRAFQVAGLLEASQSPGADDLLLARDFLNLELDALQTEGVLVRTVSRQALALTAGVTSYTLDADCIDVFVGPDNMVGTILITGGTSETLVRSIHRHEYVEISNKSSQGTPVLCYVEKQATVSVLFWPVPSVGATFNYQKIRLVRDTSDGSKTPDVWVRRQKAIVWSMAHDLAVAKSQPIERCQYLRTERDRIKEAARQDDVEQGHGQLFVAHMV